MNKLTRIISGVVATLALVVVPATSTFAQSANSNVTQSITGGTLTAAILDTSRVAVPSPSFAMTAASFSFSCQTSTGTLGSNTQRLYVINPSGTSAGQSWTLTMAGTGTWTDGAKTYAYNNAAGSGCTSGQLTVNPTAGTLTADCASTACTTASITKGSSTAMSGATPVTMLSAPVGTTVYRGYLTDVGLSQAIPAETPAGSYTLQVTLTATAA